VQTVISLSSQSAGDALREINDLGYIRHNFVLVSGDVVSNMRLAPVLATHKYDLQATVLLTPFKSQKREGQKRYYDCCV
jgi:NDP-sugar pyrophosphorylase family protein